MITPVLPLPPDRLAGIRPTQRPDSRADREGAESTRGEGSAASGSFEALTRPDGTPANVARIGAHHAHRRHQRQLEAERESSSEARSTPLAPPSQDEQAGKHQAEAGRTGAPALRQASPAFQAQLISQQLLDTDGGNARPESPGERRLLSNRQAEQVTSAYRRHQGKVDSAPLIEPHQAIDLVL
jgi:hypothetical protein